MNIRSLGFMTGVLLGLTSCTMNSNFSCNATAGDSCLTIEQVDAMTRFADESPSLASKPKIRNAKQSPFPHSGRLVQQTNGQSLWVAKKAEEHSWA